VEILVEAGSRQEFAKRTEICPDLRWTIGALPTI